VRLLRRRVREKKKGMSAVGDYDFRTEVRRKKKKKKGGWRALLGADAKARGGGKRNHQPQEEKELLDMTGRAPLEEEISIGSKKKGKKGSNVVGGQILDACPA